LGSIFVNELDTPEAFVIKHIARKIGLNIRVGKAIFNHETKEWSVPLKAIVPTILQLNDFQNRTFTYRFENIGDAIVVKDKEFQLIDFPKSDDIEENLKIQFEDITQKIESKLLKVGKQKWGRLSLVKVFLRPLYNIINAIIKDGYMPFSIIKENRQEEYFNLLKRQDFVEFDPNDDHFIRPTNILTGLHKEITIKDNRFDTNLLAEEVVGIVFSNEYRFIHSKMKNRTPSVYVDTTKTYYLNAVRIGAPITMDTNQLLSKFKIFSHSRRTSYNFNTIISELVSAKLLSKDSQENVTADKEVFQELLPLRKEILEIAIEE